MTEWDIRPARRQELDQILSLYSTLSMPGDQADDLSTAEAIFARIASYPNYTIYVAVAADTVIGVFSLLIMDNLAHGGAPSGIVEDVAVHPQWRRQGVGRKMMQFAMGKCQQAGCYKLTLSSNLQRKQAHQFYKAIGFQQHGYSFLVPLRGADRVAPATSPPNEGEA